MGIVGGLYVFSATVVWCWLGAALGAGPFLPVDLGMIAFCLLAVGLLLYCWRRLPGKAPVVLVLAWAGVFGVYGVFQEDVSLVVLWAMLAGVLNVGLCWWVEKLILKPRF